VISRRDLLKRAVSAGSAALVHARTAQAQESAIRIAGQPVEVRITQASAVTVRVTIVSPGAPSEIRADGALVERAWPAPAGRVRALAHDETVRSGDLALQVALGGREALSPAPAPGDHDRPLEIIARGKNGRVAQRLSVDAESGALSFSLGEGPLLGLGEGGPQFDRRGSTDRMRSGQGGYQLRTHGGRVPVPWIIGTDGWGLFIHQPYGTFDFTGDRGRFFPGSDAKPGTALDVFLVCAPEPPAIMAEYAKLTGHPEMPPLWSLGYQQSHRTLASRDEILQEAKTFREKKLPCDTMIYLGTGFCPSGWNTDNGEFTFNERVFPDPPRVIQQLHDDQFKVVLHIVLEGWWPDQGDGLDAPSRLARNRMYWDGARQWRPNERPFALHRNGHPGMQRYAAFLWSGDVYSTWETLKTHVPVAINTGLSGIPFWGTDIGGFVPTKELTGELYVRWFQFGAFCPLFRAHGRTWKLRLPWGWNTGELAPDEIASYTGGAANPDPSELHNGAVEPICRTYLNLRYQLLPYLYSAVREAHDTGLPIIRALWLHYPDDPLAVRRGDQYLWGRDMLVAPVTEPAATSRPVYLPGGRWYDFWTEEAHDGGQEIRRAVDLGIMPLFVRAGAILPVGPVKQHTGEPVDAPLTLQVYPGADGTFTVYEDDGVSFNHERGDWMGLKASWTDRDRRLDVRLAEGSRMRPPAERRILVRLAGATATRTITFSGTAVQVRL
jgi:alpha-glucosidase (family GH31 glycosyl hydrolase)